ncbi:MAG: hypothetical protein RL172_2959 [Bacteroidota bacterium]
MYFLKQCISVLQILVLLLMISSCKFRQKISMVLHNGVIYTADKNFAIQEAVAINDGKIVATGTSAEILRRFEADSSINLQGKPVFPGFIDAHCHFTGYATDLWKCDITGTTSFDEILTKLKQYAATNHTAWIYGRGWDQNDWQVKEFPDKKILDSLYPQQPVFLKRVDGHAALVNQRALDITGITINSKIAGGTIEVKNGKLTGILVDNAMDLVEAKIPPIADSLAQQYYLQAQQTCFAYGLTGVHDCGVSEHTLAMVEEAQKAGRLKMKIFALLTDSAHYYQKWIANGVYKTPLLHVGGFKVYADGALGSRGACLLQPYTDKPDWSGFLLSNTAHFKQLAQALAASNLQMCTHAIGDSGNRQILSVYKEVLKTGNNRRWRIEHAQVVNQNDIDFFGQYNIIPSVQPTHATSDMYWAVNRLGAQRIQGAYAYQSLLQQNGWLPLGTDFPVEDINPFKTFYAAVQRKDAKGYPATGFQPQQALTRKQALLGMTLWAAKAAFEENEKGSIEAGKAADFIILDTDLMLAPANQLLQTKVLATFVNGQKLYSY